MLLMVTKAKVSHADCIEQAEREINELMQGDASISDVIGLLVVLGWQRPPIETTGPYLPFATLGPKSGLRTLGLRTFPGRLECGSADGANIRRKKSNVAIYSK